mgnify:CR=1 FL=1
MARTPSRRRDEFRAAKEVRKLARERLGAVRAGQVIQPKTKRKAPKHPKRDRERWLEE